MNIFELTELPEEQELTDILVQCKNVRIERILSAGQISPEGFWYDQKENEFVFLVQGEATIAYEDKHINLHAGDTVILHAHEKHRVEYTSIEPPCIWFCIFYI